MSLGKNFHESFAAGEVKLPTERSTGIVFAVVALLVAVWWRSSPVTPWVALAISALLLVLSFLAPTLLRPLNLLWFRFGLLLHRIVNPVVMLAMFAVVFVPAGLLMRIWHDPLRLRGKGAGETYWIERGATGDDHRSMTNQF
jgi:hypothetical protein